MIPSADNSDYPKFVADQVLTSDNLNDLFGYLDEQGRMTRTNLSGIGIVCGLDVKTSADGSSITITKGVGVTSSGYLASMDEDITYTKRSSSIFDAVKSEYYNKFVNIASKTQKFPLWELKLEAESEGSTDLTKTFLTDGEKIVLIFVELLEENNKNCDPNSCDDKGINVTVNFRPLLVEKSNVGDLLTGAGATASPWLNLPEIAMKRFDVTANPMFECLNLFDAYRNILNNSFLDQTQTSLTKAYNVLQPLLTEEFSTNPFAALANNFKFLNDGSISSEQLITIQYYYDLFSDILLAYSEFRKKGIEFIGMCCPKDIFPRHLLLDLAIPDTTALTSSFRHYFIPSPILSDQNKTASELKILFKKLVLLVHKFAVPSPAIKGTDKKVDSNIRITPSMLANVPFSTKSIPYYYAITNQTDELLKNWSPEKLLQGKSTRNLSYHALKYNTTEDDINKPLLFDLEPYNFLRIEGHIGKPYQHVVRNITELRNKNRLPFDIVALSSDISAITTFIKDLGKLMTSGTAAAQATLESIIGTSCHFNDLELLYDSIMAELSGKLSNEMKFFYDLKRDAQRTQLPDAVSNIPQVPLLKKTDVTFRFTNNSIGHEFELFYPTVKDLPFIPLPVFFQSLGQEGNTDVMDFAFKAILYYIEMLYETVTTSLSSFTFYNFYVRYYTLIQAVRYIKLINKLFNDRFPLSEEENDHLDALLSITADSRMVQLYTEFLRRVLQVKIMQQAGFYLISNPGIQHKAGVPLGGTFILIYHETDKTNIDVTNNIKARESLVFKEVDNSNQLKADPVVQKIKVDSTAQEHLQVLSADVDEKVVIAKDRIIRGLQKTINTDKISAEKAKAETTVTETSTSAASTVSVSATSAQTAQDINQRILGYLADSATYLNNRKADKLDEAIDDFDDGVVIADFYLPYLCCSDCPPIQMIVVGQPETPNQPPVARPGDNVSVQLPVNSVSLDGSTSSDPDGTIKSYLWELQSGPDAKIEKPTESKTNVLELKEGTYIFKLTVTDNDGATASATVTVTVLPIKNVPPVASAFAKPGKVTLSANGVGISELSGTNSIDPDGVIKSFVWSISSGPTGGSVINNPDNETTLITFSQAGTYVFKLIVTDDDGATDITTVTVIVMEPDNQPPVAVANATPATLVLIPGQANTTQLNSKGSFDPDGSIVSFNWSLLSGPTSGSVINNPDNQTTAVTFTQAGSYQFKLTVTDNRGSIASVNTAVTVIDNQPPVAVALASPLSIVINPGQAATAQLDGSNSSDPDGKINSFLWTLPTGTTGAQIVSPNAAKSVVQISQPGNYKFALTVTDDGGKTDSASVSINVTQEVPVQKTCALLNSIISDFDKLSGADTAANFKLFTARYADLREITVFFNLMKTSDVINIPVDAQIKFFIDQKIESRLVTWIDDLKMFLIEVADFRLLALLTLNILTELAYFISCIQKDDVNKAEVKMINSLSSVINSLNTILQVVLNFQPEHLKVLSILQSFSNAERTRVKNNNEESAKPTYVEILTKIIEILKAMNL